MRLRTVRMSKVVGGQIYIEVSVAVGGFLFLDHHVFHGRPFKNRHGKWWFRTKRKDPDALIDRLFNFTSTDDCGLTMNGFDNLHRTFRYTTRNEQILSNLVKHQALREYLVLIGIDPDVAESDGDDWGD